MTNDDLTTTDKKTPTQLRNEAICAYYLEGHKLADVASKFKLGRQRTQQILIAGGAWKPYKRSDRTKFLGVTVAGPTKEALEREAQEKGVSVSRLTSDLLDEHVGEVTP